MLHLHMYCLDVQFPEHGVHAFAFHLYFDTCPCVLGIRPVGLMKKASQEIQTCIAAS